MATMVLLSSANAMAPSTGHSRIRPTARPLSATSSKVSLLDTARMIRMERLQSEKANNSDDVNRQSGLFGKKYLAEENNNLDMNQLFGDSTSSLFEFDVDLLDDDSMAQKIKEQEISKLQKATGSEVLDMELHLQMEAARRRAKQESPKEKGSAIATASAFVDSNIVDASPSEKFAMKMIPSQLPAPVRVEPKASAKTRTSVIREKKMVQKGSLNTPGIQPPNASTFIETSSTKSAQNKRRKTAPTSRRVTQEQEIQLAQIIQKGAKVQRIKADFESKHQRDITKKEWTELANLDSPKTLRRLISSYRTAKNELVSANLGLVYAVVRQGPQRKNGISEEELVQEGTLGLIRAAELFDPDKGLRFSTYATIWIKGVLGNSKLDQAIVLPSREKIKWNKIQRATVELRALHNIQKDEDDGSIITPKELAEMTSIPVKEIMDLQYKMPRTKNMLSLDYQYTGTTRSGTQQDSSNEIYGNSALAENDLVETLQMKADIVAALARNLEPREARLMRLRYGLHDGKMRTIVECAECMGLSRQRVQQLAVKCLEKLREANDCKSLQEYLLTVA